MIHRLKDKNKPKTKEGIILVDRRKGPRLGIELPFHYTLVGEKEVQQGVVADASEGGLLVHLLEKVDIGAFLRIEMFSAKWKELITIKAIGKVVWSDLGAWESWGEYHYGIQFISFFEGDFQKLKILLREAGQTGGSLPLGEISPPQNVKHGIALQQDSVNISIYDILVVDFDIVLRNKVASILSKRGYHCFQAADGMDALDIAFAEKLDAVITDVLMPKMDGITLVKRVLKRIPRLPIMVMTPPNNEFSPVTAIAVGAQEFIKKPFSLTELAVRFDKMMRNHEVPTETEAKEKGRFFHDRRESLEGVNRLYGKIESLKKQRKLAL
jgi:CheY-like chemotaxis protein